MLLHFNPKDAGSVIFQNVKHTHPPHCNTFITTQHITICIFTTAIISYCTQSLNDATHKEWALVLKSGVKLHCLVICLKDLNKFAENHAWVWCVVFSGGPLAGHQQQELETGGQCCPTARLFRLPNEAGAQVEGVETAVLCAQGRVSLLLSGQQLRWSSWYVIHTSGTLWTGIVQSVKGPVMRWMGGYHFLCTVQLQAISWLPNQLTWSTTSSS